MENQPRFVPLDRLPLGLRELKEPPAGLFVAGALPRFAGVAVVGTRRPTVEAEEITAALVKAWVGEGLAILSGGAEGIDAAAHRAALDAGGTTIVVAPAGFARPYPEHHEEMFREIVDRGGAHVALVEPNTSATRGAFFRRNEVLAAMSHAVVIVEAGVRSGARNAAKHARALGRPLFCVPWSPGSAGRGCNIEIRHGATLLLGARDIPRCLASRGWVGAGAGSPHLDQLPLFVGDAATLEPTRPAAQRQGGFRGARGTFDEKSHAGSSQAPSRSDLMNHLAERVLSALSEGELSVDELSERLGARAEQLQVELLQLSLEGVIEVLPTGRVFRVTP